MENLIVPLLFFAIWFIGWIINLVKGNDAQQQRQNRPARNRAPQQRGPQREQRLQREIDSFLEEIGAKKQPDRAAPREVNAPRQREQRPQRGSVATQADQPRQRKPTRQQTQTRKPTSSGSDRKSSSQQRPAPQPQSRAQQSERRSRLGSGVTSHVEKYMKDHVQDYLQARREGLSKSSAVAGLNSTLSDEESLAAEQVLAIEGSTPLNADSIGAMLRNPTQIRQAIILGEILDRPRVFRR